MARDRDDYDEGEEDEYVEEEEDYGGRGRKRRRSEFIVDVAEEDDEEEEEEYEEEEYHGGASKRRSSKKGRVSALIDDEAIVDSYKEEEEEEGDDGKYMSMLPVDPKIGKMLIMGAIFRCFDPILTIAAGLSVRDPFLLSQDKKDLAGIAKSRFSAKDYSDHMALVRAYEGWKDAEREGAATTTKGAAEVFTFIGQLEFFYDQSPDAMRSLCSALSLLTTCLGNYLTSFILTVVDYVTTARGGLGWIPNNLNEGHLDYFFWLLAGLSLLNLIFYVVFALKYKQKKEARF